MSLGEPPIQTTFPFMADEMSNEEMALADHTRDHKGWDEHMRRIEALEPLMLPKVEEVNHPRHYTQGAVECIDAIAAATVGKSGIEAVCVANVLKYLWRYENKGGRRDAEKAKWYLERLLKVMPR